MASVNYMKAKTPQDVKRTLRHCDKEMRKKDKHANQHIDINVTDRNLQFHSYEETCEKYDKRIAYLDSLAGANKRKDRVTCFFLEVPFPEALTSPNFTLKDCIQWCNRVNALVEQQYGKKNVIGGYIHFDEQHEYKDAETGKRRVSRAHLHFGCIPEHDGKLNGKWFSSRANMVKLNESIQKMTLQEFGIEFMNGSKKKSAKTVEQLKLESDIADLREQYDDLVIKSKIVKNDMDANKAHRDALRDDISRLESERQQRLAENDKMAQIASERVTRANALLEESKKLLQDAEKYAKDAKLKAMKQRAMDLEFQTRNIGCGFDRGLER